ncbi:hypothetical protein B0H14DRAFT_2608274 [Mycena olivaceomarginata]|nr:hypothetical protein B0H14DRAFT_2608274 [Mycena olivaceomarginata]
MSVFYSPVGSGGGQSGQYQPKGILPRIFRRAKKAPDDAHDSHFKPLPVVITTGDSVEIVVDGGYKNMHCARLRRRFASLVSIQSDIFDDVHAFQEWFFLLRMNASLPSGGMGTFISTQHTILKPVLLRKIKGGCIRPLFPPNKCYILCARLGARQWEASEAILARLKRKSMGKEKVTAAERDAEEQEHRREAEVFAQCGAAARDVLASIPLCATRRRQTGRLGLMFSLASSSSSYPSSAHSRLYHLPRIRTPMPTASYQRAKSPHLSARAPPTSEVLAAYEAEMLLLDWLLGELFKLGHKNPPLSRFTTRLDIIEAVDMKGWRICRIDETTPPRPDERPPELPSVPRLLCLRCSARAAAASALMDTVIFHDQDWNARSRSARTGLGGRSQAGVDLPPISTHTIEEKIVQQATEKLEALAIEKGTGKFKTRGRAGRRAPHDDTGRRREHLQRRGLRGTTAFVSFEPAPDAGGGGDERGG